MKRLTALIIATVVIIATLSLLYYANTNMNGSNNQQTAQRELDSFNGTQPIVTLPKVNNDSIEVKIDKVNYFDTIRWYRIYYREGIYYKIVDTDGKFLREGYDWSDGDWKFVYMFKSTDANENKKEFIDVTIDGLSANTLYEVKVVAEEYNLFVQQVRTQGA